MEVKHEIVIEMNKVTDIKLRKLIVFLNEKKCI